MNVTCIRFNLNVVGSMVSHLSLPLSFFLSLSLSLSHSLSLSFSLFLFPLRPTTHRYLVTFNGPSALASLAPSFPSS